jgi:hypothetical protein
MIHYCTRGRKSQKDSQLKREPTAGRCPPPAALKRRREKNSNYIITTQNNNSGSNGKTQPYYWLATDPTTKTRQRNKERQKGKITGED